MKVRDSLILDSSHGDVLGRRNVEKPSSGFLGVAQRNAGMSRKILVRRE
jgi:hypothetical protein